MGFLLYACTLPVLWLFSAFLVKGAVVGLNHLESAI